MYIRHMESEVTLVIDPQSSAPVYRQVVDNLRSLLVSGALKPGDALPTVRELGLELGVHFNTIAEAYRLLAGEGWLDLRRRRGAVVLERAAPAAQSRPSAESSAGSTSCAWRCMKSRPQASSAARGVDRP